MTSCPIFVTGILCCVLAACAVESNDQGVEGTYHLAITFNARDSSPVDPLTSTVSWPSAADLTLHFKDARTGQIEFLGEQVKYTRPG
jgi:hypothetical protein